MVATALAGFLQGCRPPSGGADEEDGGESGGSESTDSRRDSVAVDSAIDSGEIVEFVFQRLILVTLDTVRTDLITPEHMPFLSSLQADGLAFSNLWGQSFTYSGVGQILTTQHPVAWGAASWAPTEDYGPPALDPEIPTLATAVSELGWSSIYFTANSVASTTTGLDRGYGEVRGMNDGASIMAVNDAGTWVQDHGQSPQLIHFHLNDSHDPYDLAIAPCAAEVEALDPGSCRYDFQHDPRATDNATADVENGIFGPEEADWEACIDLLETAYVCEVESLDMSLEESFDAMVDFGLTDGAVVLVATDHGEGLFDPLPGHSFDSHAHITRTFGLILAPGLVEPGVVTAPVSQTDLVPGIAAMLDLDLGLPTTGMPWDESEESRVLTTFWVGTSPGGEFRHDHGAIGGGFHYLKGSTGVEALYDLAADPSESVELLAGGASPPEALAAAIELQERETEGFGLASSH